MRAGRIAAAASLVFVAGCCAPKGFGRTRATDPTTAAPSRVRVLEPSPVLQLVRQERIAMAGPRASTHAPSSDETEAAGDASDATEATHDGETVEAEGISRTVVVRRRRFATHEDLARAAIRNAEARRPRALYVTRLLLRHSGPICDCDGDLEERARVRAAMHAMVERARPALKLCLSEEMAADPRVLVKAPSLLVVAQARMLGSIVYRLSPSFTVTGNGIELEELGWQGNPGAALEGCLARAFTDAWQRDGAFLETPHRVQLPLVAFVQAGWGMNLGSPLGWLALQAAVLGWLHYERGEYEEAIEFFEDAWWAFHLEEYKYLQALAYEKLGERTRAADAYATYLAARPYAPEAPVLPERIAKLREAAAAR